MQKFRWLSLVLSSFVFLEGCGKFPKSDSNKTKKECSDPTTSSSNPEANQSWNQLKLDQISPAYQPFSTCENIYAYIREKSVSQSCHEQATAQANTSTSEMPEDSGAKSVSSSEAADTSDVVTNLRERGVDEADMAKVSKDHIFVASSGQVAVLDRTSKQLIGLLKVSQSYPRPNSGPEILMDYSSFEHPQLLTKDDRLLVITTSAIQVYTLEAKKLPVLKQEVPLQGPTSEVRLIANRLLILSSHYSRVVSTHSGNYGSVVRSLPCDSTYPDMHSGPIGNGVSITQIKSIDLDDLKKQRTIAFLQQFSSYITTKNIYLYSSQYRDDSTQIRKISLSENGDFLEVATGTVKGHIKDSWALSESGANGEYLSVVSTSSRSRSSQLAVLTTINLLLSQIGIVGDFGVDESVKSVRKIGDIVFVVTFREIDPLFAIDISNVKSPKILSALKIPGFSTYMHPFGANRLIGLGYTGGRNFNSGVQLSLFDTTTLTDVKRLDAINVGEPGSDSIATADYHAFYMDQENALVGIPVDLDSAPHILPFDNALPPNTQVGQVNASVLPERPTLPRYRKSGAVLYKIGLSNIEFFKFISHEDFEVSPTKSEQPGMGLCWAMPPCNHSKIKRLFKVDNQLISISENAIKSFDISPSMPMVTSTKWENENSCPVVPQEG